MKQRNMFKKMLAAKDTASCGIPFDKSVFGFSMLFLKPLCWDMIESNNESLYKMVFLLCKVFLLQRPHSSGAFIAFQNAVFLKARVVARGGGGFELFDFRLLDRVEKNRFSHLEHLSGSSWTLKETFFLTVSGFENKAVVLPGKGSSSLNLNAPLEEGLKHFFENYFAFSRGLPEAASVAG